MRRILKTTTALVASLSLILPQIAMAEGQPELPRRERQEKPQQKSDDRPSTRERQEKPREREEKPRKQHAPAEKPRSHQESHPQPEQRRAPPGGAAQGKPSERGAAPANENAAPRRDRPDQPPRREAAPERPAAPGARSRQDSTPVEQRRREEEAPGRRTAPPTGQARPAPRDETRDRPAPDRKEPADRDRARQQAPDAGDTSRKPPPDAAELRRQMERDQQDRPGRPAGARDAAQPRDDQAEAPRRKSPPATGDQLREDGRAPRAANRDAPPSARDADIPRRQDMTPAVLQRRLDEGHGRTRIEAPERSARSNEVVRRAAEPARRTSPPVALVDNPDPNIRHRVYERRISDDNFRRPDQDFRTRLEDGERPLSNEEIRRRLEQRSRELREDERRVDRRDRELDRREDYLDNYYDDYYRDDDDNDDNNNNDLAKLLLAGVAGFAVGKMLSNNRQVALNSGDRVVTTLPDGSQQVVRDDNALLYQPGSNVQTETFEDGSTRTTVWRSDGSRVVTIRDADLNVLRRTLIRPDGSQTMLIDDSNARPVDVSTLPPPRPVEYVNRPLDENELREALLQEAGTDRRFTLSQIRDIPEVRSLVAPVNLANITFDTGSAALRPDQAEQLAALGKVMREAIDRNPNEMFLIEGYTDAVGSAAANLALSDRRAESVALALTQYYQVPPENMVIQGYGEQFPLLPGDGAERENRRVAVRRITDLLDQGGS